MNSCLIKTIAVLLLLAQVWVGVARGRVLCIPLADCDGHSSHRETGFSDHGACDHHHAHDHGPVLPILHQHDDCGCHVHLPAPDDYPRPPAQPRFDIGDMRSAFAPTVVALIDWSAAAPAAASLVGRPPGLFCLAQTRLLRTTRLLI